MKNISLTEFLSENISLFINVIASLFALFFALAPDLIFYFLLLYRLAI
ncbi:hypothetical protein UNSW1_1096 [Campylobacter concisus UNSW1]|nr:hypothetical protein UNSW1_1096 [Campylobacter concisus UNSW1]